MGPILVVSNLLQIYSNLWEDLPLKMHGSLGLVAPLCRSKRNAYDKADGLGEKLYHFASFFKTKMLFESTLR